MRQVISILDTFLLYVASLVLFALQTTITVLSVLFSCLAMAIMFVVWIVHTLWVNLTNLVFKGTIS